MTSQLLADLDLRPNNLDAVAIGVGPGSFTGVRIAASFGQAMAFALDVPMVAVTSTELVAQAAGIHGYDKVWVALDARLGELYTACYSRYSLEDAWQEQQPPTLMKPDTFAALLAQQPQGCGSERTCAAGDGFAVYPQTRLAANGLPAFAAIKPSAGALATIAAREWQTRGVDPISVAAMYVRNDVAQTTEQRQALRLREAAA
jgi:tRNA threonylcarbamoyladenosine biosynthesis protein TsaB